MIAEETVLIAAIRSISEDGITPPLSEIPLIIERLNKSHDRYEKLRKVTVHVFQELCITCLETGTPFDELVDKL